MAIARFIRCLETDTPIPFYGDGSSRRDYTYIDDIADGVEAALERSFPFDIVNLGGAHPVTLAELVAAVERATGRRARLDRQPLQPGDVPITFADVRKAKRLWGWEPRVPIEDGIERFAAWFRAHRMP